MSSFEQSLLNNLDDCQSVRHYGRVSSVLGMMVEGAGLERWVSVGHQCVIINRMQQRIPSEVVGFKSEKALLMPYGTIEGIGLGCRIEVASMQSRVYPSSGWLGRVVNAFGQPLDGKGALPEGAVGIPVRSPPLAAHKRGRMAGKLDLGVRAMNTFLTCCKGQRMGIFAGSGVGKSVLLSMLARYTTSDVSVIGLIGERGREVKEFIEDELGEEGLARSVVVVATSDEPPLVRRQAAYLTMCIAEFFRDMNQDVLCMIDSITRFAMAQREIGLSAGEPPTTKGYPPTTFTELPKLLERSGPGQHNPNGKSGSITGLFTVLVEGDDTNEPISDAVRGILDGHIILSRAIAERGRFPAVDILKSVSRALPNCNIDEENALLRSAREVLSTYENMAELIRLGAYRRGSDPTVDRAITLYPLLENFLRQGRHEHSTLADGYGQLTEILASA